MQIKTTVSYHLIVVRMAITKMSRNKCSRGCGEKGTILHYWWECKLIQPLWRTVWRFLKKVKIELPYDPAFPLLGIYPEKTIIQKDTCIPCLQGRNWDTDVENECIDTKGGKRRRGGGGGVMNWAIGIDMYAMMCIKLMTNKDLLYK